MHGFKWLVRGMDYSCFSKQKTFTHAQLWICLIVPISLHQFAQEAGGYQT